MAKKRKEATEEQEFDFNIPKFDEEAFMKRERRNIKTVFIAFLFGLLIAVISFGFWALLSGSFLRWELVLLVGVVNSIWLRYIFLRINIDLTDFGRKGWASVFATYFFTWLLLFIVLVNPPFYDDEAPHLELAVLPGMQEPGGSVILVAHIIDNVGVNKAGITLTIIDPNGTVFSPEFQFENNIFRYTYENTNSLLGQYNYSLVASDVNGHKTFANGSFIYNQTALEIISSRFTGLMSGDAITIKADERISNENFRVYYTINNGSEINVSRKDQTDKEKYDTTAEFQGWTSNSTVTVHVYAEARHYFANIPDKFSNTVADTKVYTFTTATDSNIGTKKPLVEYNYTLAALRKPQSPNTLNYPLPYPVKMGATPGFEAIIAVLAIVVVIFLFKRKKKDNQT
jgi:hypothetical protein